MGPASVVLQMRISHATSLVLLLAVLAGCGGNGGAVAGSTGHFPEKTGFVERQLKLDGQERTYWVFVPPNYERNRMYPGVLFLHGLFEKGNGGSKVLGAGLGPVIARNPEGWPFITIFPQSDGTWQGDERARLAIAALEDAEKHYSIDPDRVTLAGLSYGGLGVWEIGARHCERFAALVPVSAVASTEAQLVTSVPVWAFNSRNDPFVSAEHAKQLCDSVKANGGKARMTEFMGDTHDCWPQVVDESEVIGWMLVQRRDPLRSGITSRGDGSRTQASGRLRAWNDR
jgi:predicted peptidase